ncbi:DUF674 family protein, partial [Trifolium medium]|nr:DUF674 family protein [Trifolium medium]
PLKLLDGGDLVEEDMWVWHPESGGFFKVKSAYSLLAGRVVIDVRLSSMEEKVFHNLWKSLHDRVLTKRNLLHRRIIPIEESTRETVFSVLERRNQLYIYFFIAKFVPRVC